MEVSLPEDASLVGRLERPREASLVASRGCTCSGAGSHEAREGARGNDDKNTNTWFETFKLEATRKTLQMLRSVPFKDVAKPSAQTASRALSCWTRVMARAVLALPAHIIAMYTYKLLYQHIIYDITI